MPRHQEFTSEFSKPHVSKACPTEHVDQMHFGKEGRHVPEFDNDHITDSNAIQMGKETYDFHQGSSSSGFGDNNDTRGTTSTNSGK